MTDTMENGESGKMKSDATTPETDVADLSGELEAANASLNGATSSDDATDTEESLTPEATLQRELEAANDRILRISAELDNYRKRVQREVQEERRYAAMPLMRELLPVVDNLKRTIEAAEKSGGGVDGLLEGVVMVLDQFESALARHGCVKIEACGKSFDPNFHDAILQRPSTEVAPNMVLAETLTGYRLHDRVVRPSQVIVSAKSE
ncbi:MAG: nucleotide exchange factor GrpE [Planctomycetia bacterium]|nr:nucleotide exchange factor GrpE [Planctomycetia bacterium]